LTLGPGSASFSLRYYSSYGQVFILYVILRDLARDPRVFQGITIVFFLTYFGGSLLTDLGVTVVTAGTEGGRVGLVGFNLNAYAFGLAVIVAGGFSWALARWPRLGWKGWLFMGSLAVLVPAIASTGSRGGAVALVFGLFVAIVVNMQLRRLPVYVFLVPVVLGAVFHVMLNTEVLQRRVEATLYEHDYGARDVLAEGSLVLFRQDPLIGPGPGYMEALGRLTGRSRIAAHNTYLQILRSFGILGTLPFFVAYGLTMNIAWKARGSAWGGVWFTILAMTMAFGMVGHLGYDKHFWIILALGSNVASMANVRGRVVGWGTRRAPHVWRTQGSRVPAGVARG